MTTTRPPRRGGLLAVSLALALVLALGGAGCGGGAAVAPGPAAPPSPPAVPAAPASASPPAGATTGTPPAGTAAAPSRCTSAHLAVTLGPAEGAAGSVYRQLVFTNTAARACELRGFPGVSYVAGDDGHQVGPAALMASTHRATPRRCSWPSRARGAPAGRRARS